MMHAKTITETIKKMIENVDAHTQGFTTDPWPGKSFEQVAGKVDVLAQLAQTKAVAENPEAVLRSAARLGEQVLGL